MLGPCRGLARHQLDTGAQFAKMQVEMRREARGEAAANQQNAPAWISKQCDSGLEILAQHIGDGRLDIVDDGARIGGQEVPLWRSA